MASRGLPKDDVLEITGAIVDGEASKSETTDTLPESKPKSSQSVLKNTVPGSVGASKGDTASKVKGDDEKEQRHCCMYINTYPTVESSSYCDTPRAANSSFCVNHQLAAISLSEGLSRKIAATPRILPPSRLMPPPRLQPSS